MFSPNAVRFAPEELRSLAFGSIGANYAAIGGPTEHPACYVILVNGTDHPVLISLDGATDHLVVLNGQTLAIDVSSNRTDMSGALFVPQRTTFYVKETTAPTSGSVYLSIFYPSDV